MDTLQHIRAEYLRHLDAGGERVQLELHSSPWVPDAIHISDLGGCPRSIMLRISNAKKKEESQSVQDNMQVLWWLGYRLHYLTYESLIWDKRMLKYETAVECEEGITGRFDMMWQGVDRNIVELTDIKSARSMAWKYGELALDPPQAKPEHIAQVGGYLLYVDVDAASVHYVDRGGSNTPITVPISIPEAKETATRLLSELKEARAALPELPNPLPAVLKEHYSRAADRHINKLGIARDWHCLYCSFAGASCQPEGPEEEITLANLEKSGKWKFTPSGNRTSDWIEEQVASRC